MEKRDHLNRIRIPREVHICRPSDYSYAFGYWSPVLQITHGEALAIVSKRLAEVNTELAKYGH